MDENFATRRKLYGDETLGRKNLQMVDICQKYGAHCKFPGNFKLDFPILIVFFGPTIVAALLLPQVVVDGFENNISQYLFDDSAGPNHVLSKNCGITKLEKRN